MSVELRQALESELARFRATYAGRSSDPVVELSLTDEQGEQLLDQMTDMLLDMGLARAGEVNGIGMHIESLIDVIRPGVESTE